MKKVLVGLVIVGVVGFFMTNSFADNTASVDTAVQSAEQWLGMVDSKKYNQSWQEAASLFKASISKDAWGKSMQTVRGSLGKVLFRTRISGQYMTTLPGAPDGEYVVIQYQTRFENKAAAVETITPMLDKDGKWRISGYFVR